ncbi:MAG TPA: hypothetical protein VL326_34685 [Kofleriaceae bacterium]|nr:hypothetical protein [Kofleriaceae bacterium]
MKTILLALVVLAGCNRSKPKMTMKPEEVIEAIRDLADRGCECGTDKECFRAVRDEWEQTRKTLLFNANLLEPDDKKAYDVERGRFGMCGDAAGLTVFDNV